MNHAANERAALVQLMSDLGPEADTAIDGWTTHDLAAHLVARERKPLAAPGLVLSPLHGVTAAIERRTRQVPYEYLLDQLRSGPPLWWVGGLLRGPLAGAADLHEFFVHHEDVRRARDPMPRSLGADLQRALWTRVRLLGPLLAARAHGLGLVAVTPDGQRAPIRDGELELTLRGTPGELLLWLFGRRELAHVELEGSRAAQEAARQAALGV